MKKQQSQGSLLFLGGILVASLFFSFDQTVQNVWGNPIPALLNSESPNDASPASEAPDNADASLDSENLPAAETANADQTSDPNDTTTTNETADPDALPSRVSPQLQTDRALERTSFQQAGGYDPRFDLKTDVVMVYGISDNDIEMMKSWKANSTSKITVMTGVAWGEYQDYLNGKVDGQDHWEEAQVRSNGSRVMHGPEVPYMVPSLSFGEYLENRLKKVVDAGIDTLYLEEPELWAFSGFSQAFQREWQIYYNEPWIAPDTDCDAQYRSAKLMQTLYRRLLDRLALALKDYSLRKYQRPLNVYIATHSLVSYAQIQMVSPESDLLDLPAIDGLIAQIWTGTSRAQNMYQGEIAERTFEAGLLEYNSMQEMIRGTGKRVYFLNDPVEDNPKYDWNDYRQNYLSTLVASLMQSETDYFEVAPWPSRIFLGEYPSGSPDATPIPEEYASTLTLVFNQLRDMKQSEISWDNVTQGIGVLLSDSAMYQRANPTVRDCATDDPDDETRPSAFEIRSLGSFYGLTMPLIKHGVPVDVPILDHVLRYPGYLDHFKVLVLSYEFQKPLHPGIHAALADWIQRGGVLVYIGAETDSYHDAWDWWNTNAASDSDKTTADEKIAEEGSEEEPEEEIAAGESSTFSTPTEHLMQLLGLDRIPDEGKYPVGKGWVFVDRHHPAFFNRSKENADQYRHLISDALSQTDTPLIEKNYFLKYRGPYVLAAVLTESLSETPLTLKGSLVNLFDPQLNVVPEVSLNPGERAWFLDLNRITAKAPVLLASSGRLEDWVENKKTVEFTLSGVQNVSLISLVLLPKRPKKVQINDAEIQDYRWDKKTKTLFLKHKTDGTDKVIITL